MSWLLEPFQACLPAPSVWGPQLSPSVQVATHSEGPEESQQEAVSAKQLEPSELSGVSLHSGLEPWKEAMVHPSGSYSSNSGHWGQQPVFSIHSITPTSPKAAHFVCRGHFEKKQELYPSHVPVPVGSAAGVHPPGAQWCAALGQRSHLSVPGRSRQSQSDGEEDFCYMESGTDMLTDPCVLQSPCHSPLLMWSPQLFLTCHCP